MNQNPSMREWLLPIEGIPVDVTVTHNHVARDAIGSREKAFIAGDIGDILGTVGADHQMCTNLKVVSLSSRFYLKEFSDSTAWKWTLVQGHWPSATGWTAMDCHHRANAINLLVNGGRSEVFTPFVRITDRYNNILAMRADAGLPRGHGSQSVIIEKESAILKAPHTKQGGYPLKIARPFAGMPAQRDKIREARTAVWFVRTTQEEDRALVRHVTTRPQLKEDLEPRYRHDQAKLDVDLKKPDGWLLRRYRRKRPRGPQGYDRYRIPTRRKPCLTQRYW